MDTSLLLSLLGIFISLYAIADSCKKRNLKYKLSILHSIIFGILLLLFLILILVQGYYELEDNNVKLTTLTFFKIRYELNYTFDYLFSAIALSLVIILSIYFAYLLFNGSIKLKNKFIDNLQSNYNQNKYGVVITDVDVFFKCLMKNYSLKEKMPEKNDYMTIMLNKKELTKYSLMKNKIINFFNKNNNNYSRKLESYFSDILNDGSFVKELSLKNPVLGNKIIKSELKMMIKRDFLNMFVKELIKNNKSILYRQIKYNQNIDISNNYILYPENYVLYTLFKDIKLAEELYAWMPVGEGVLEYLNEQKRKNEDIENRKEEDYREKAWHSPIFIGIRYFDIMVKEALYRNVNWHMCGVNP